jgi:hypothetical protein
MDFWYYMKGCMNWSAINNSSFLLRRIAEMVASKLATIDDDRLNKKLYGRDEDKREVNQAVSSLHFRTWRFSESFEKERYNLANRQSGKAWKYQSVFPLSGTYH